MIYSTEPLIGDLNTHMGFFVCVAFVLVIVFSTLFLKMFEESLSRALKETFRVLLILSVGFLLPVGLISWNSGTEYKNTPIEATLVATSEAEALEYRHKRGDVYTISSFVTYATPDGEVVFKRKEGVVYPKRAILYRN